MKKSYNLFKLGSFLVLFASFILASAPAVYAEDKAEEAKEEAAKEGEASTKATDSASTDEKKSDGKKKGKDGEEPECE